MLTLCSSWPWLTNSNTTLPAGTLARDNVSPYSNAVICTCGIDGGGAGGGASPPRAGGRGAVVCGVAPAAGAAGVGRVTACVDPEPPAVERCERWGETPWSAARQRRW